MSNWPRTLEPNNALKPHIAPICAPNHWNTWNSFTMPSWQLHVPRKTSPTSNYDYGSPRLNVPHNVKNNVVETAVRSPIYVPDSPSPHHSIITISSSSDEDHDDLGLSCGLLKTSRTKIEVPSPENEIAATLGLSNNAMQTASPAFAEHVSSNMPHFGHQLHVKTSPQRALVSHSITSLIQPKSSPGNHRICCRQPQGAIGEIPANLCYLHVPVTVARMDTGTPENAALASPNVNGAINHLYPFRRQGINGFVPQLPSSQTAFTPVCAVVTTAASSPSRLQLLHPCFISPASNSYAQSSLVYPHLQPAVQHSAAPDPCGQGNYLMTPTMGGISQPHSCNSLITDNGMMRLGRQGQLHTSPYSTSQVSPQRRMHHIGYAGSILNPAGYQTVEPSNAYLAYTCYGAHRP